MTSARIARRAASVYETGANVYSQQFSDTEPPTVRLLFCKIRLRGTHVFEVGLQQISSSSLRTHLTPARSGGPSEATWGLRERHHTSNNASAPSSDAESRLLPLVCSSLHFLLKCCSPRMPPLFCHPRHPTSRSHIAGFEALRNLLTIVRTQRSPPVRRVSHRHVHDAPSFA